MLAFPVASASYQYFGVARHFVVHRRRHHGVCNVCLLCNLSSSAACRRARRGLVCPATAHRGGVDKTSIGRSFAYGGGNDPAAGASYHENQRLVACRWRLGWLKENVNGARMAAAASTLLSWLPAYINWPMAGARRAGAWSARRSLSVSETAGTAATKSSIILASKRAFPRRARCTIVEGPASAPEPACKVAVVARNVRCRRK